MLRYTLLSLFCLLGATSAAFGDIYVWEGDPNDCTIDDFYNRIQINAAGTYGFRAWNGDPGSPALEEIQNITVDASVTGTVTVKIAYDAEGDDGATDLWELDLTAGSGTGNLGGLRISGDLATTDDVVCDDVTGDIYVGGDLGNLGSPSTELRADDVTGSFTISGDLWDDVSVNTLADFTAGDSSGSTVDGDIAIAQGYSATMTINDLYGGDITVGGEMSGLIDINRNMVNASITIGTPGANANLTGGIETKAIGTILVNGNVSSGGLIDGQTFLNGLVQVTGDLSGAIVIDSQIGSPGRILIGGDLTSTGSIDVGQFVEGRIEIGDDLHGLIDVVQYLEGRIVIGDAVTQSDPTVPAIHIHGKIKGTDEVDPNEPRIEVGSELGAVIAIDRELQNVVAKGVEIQVGSLDPNDPNSLGAIAIDYDGYDAGDQWDPNAVIKVGTTEYTGNAPAARVYEITNCKGDMNNNEELDADGADYQALSLAVDDPNDYAEDFPGLYGSLYYHGDMDCDAELDDTDEAILDHFDGGDDCCFETCDDYGASRVDFDADGVVGLSDLAALLAKYGTDPNDPNWDPLYDTNADDEVGLADLAELLGYYGSTDTCFSGDGRGSGGGRSSVSVYVEAYDTGGYQGGGFNGEVDHFVFDLKIEVSAPNSDDWVATGGVLDTYNDATFRLSTSATTPDQYATFVAAPWTTVPGSATASVAGAYDPPDPTPEFTTTGINLAWYDTDDSNDGPATVMRIVIDVSEVSGADVSDGFGSVYFSTSGKIRMADILLADLVSETATAQSAPGLESLSGEFYVKGQN